MSARKRSKQQGPEQEDPFIRRVNQIVAWAQRNQRAVVAGAVVLVLAVAAAVYYQNYRQGVVEQASAEFQQLRTSIPPGTPPDTVASRLRQFVDRYGATSYATDARLILARIYMDAEQPERVLEALGPLTSRDAASPAGYAAATLRAGAYEDAGQPDRAMEIYATIARTARFPNEQRAASADRARLLVEQGRLEEAEEIYTRLVEETPEDAPDLGSYQVRLGEVRAALASGLERVPGARRPGGAPAGAPGGVSGAAPADTGGGG